MAWQDAVESTLGGCAILLTATPGAQTQAFPAGVDLWRKRINIHVQSEAQGGAANRDILATIAKFFGQPVGQVELTTGGKSRRKRVVVHGVDVVAARGLLEAAL